jgi:MarR family transcriptional regulator, transcriptional regulator for hemolysin
MKNLATKASSKEKSAAKKPAVPAKAPKTKKTAGGDENNWDQRLGFLMHDVSRLRRVVFDDFMKPLGVTRSQWWVLAYLSRQDGMIQSDLASVLELGKAALGGLIDRLEASEFIERRSDAVDRRAKRIYLTTRGTQIIKEMRQLSHEMSERILEGLTLDQRGSLFEMLSLVKKNLLTIKHDEGIEE